MQDKNKNKLMRETFSCFFNYKTTLHFFCTKHFNKQHQPILFKEQQFLVLKGVKRKINIINGSLTEQRALLLPNPYIHTNEIQMKYTTPSFLQENLDPALYK